MPDIYTYTPIPTYNYACYEFALYGKDVSASTWETANDYCVGLPLNECDRDRKKISSCSNIYSAPLPSGGGQQFSYIPLCGNGKKVKWQFFSSRALVAQNGQLYLRYIAGYPFYKEGKLYSGGNQLPCLLFIECILNEQTPG